MREGKSWNMAKAFIHAEKCHDVSYYFVKLIYVNKNVNKNSSHNWSLFHMWHVGCRTLLLFFHQYNGIIDFAYLMSRI